MLDTRIFTAQLDGQDVIGAEVFVDATPIARVVCVNVKTRLDNTADYRVTLRENKVERTKMLYGFDRDRGALELIHDAVELMRAKAQGRY